MAGSQNQLPVDPTSRKKLSKAGQKTAEDILVAAERLFSQKGFKATTLKEVSEASSANTALISYYFGNKDGLRDAVFAKQLKKAGSGFESLFAVDVSSFNNENFKQMIRVFLETSETDDTLFRLMTWSTVDSGDIARKMTSVIWAPFYGRLAEIVEHIGGGNLTRQDAHCRVWALLGTVHGYVHSRWHTSKHLEMPESNDIFFKRYKDLLVDKVTDTLLGA
ncbi:MAG: TetR family transcriptional regulator [Bdellovibrionota bacterium]